MARRKGNRIHGWVNVDKRPGMTSTQAIGALRRLLHPDKIGHAGTLDPLATGILPIALGEATKTIPFAQDATKDYTFDVVWGEQRSTDDAEGEVIAASDFRPAEDEIRAALPAFIGTIMQIPPRFSAIKVDGQRAYDIARNGNDVELEAREAYVESFELTDCDGDRASFRVTCGKGVYMRSLARDLAVELGTVGYITRLCRTRVGPFDVKNAISLDILEKMDESARLERCLLPLETALDDIPALAIGEPEAVRLRSGQALTYISRGDMDRLSAAGIEVSPEPKTCLALLKGRPVAIADIKGVEIRPVRVFNL